MAAAIDAARMGYENHGISSLMTFLIRMMPTYRSLDWLDGKAEEK